jgi:glycosyltransferase involved in cell wall biosynthesis
MTRVDVVIPCYRYGRFLRSCAESVLSQRDVAVRVLVLDDASPDETPQVSAALARDDPRVEYRRHEVNRGHIATYNEGLDWISAEYALLLSADDALTPGALGRAVRLMERHSEVGFTFGRRIVWPGDEAPPAAEAEVADAALGVVSRAEFIEGVCRRCHNPVCTPTAVVRTSTQKRVGGYRPELPHTGDLEMWLRLAAASEAVGIVNAEQAYWRAHGGNMRGQYEGLRDAVEHKAAFDSFFREWGDRIKGADRLRAMCHRELAMNLFWSASKAFDRGLPETCARFLDLACEIDPRVQSGGPWNRLQLKRRLGARAWRAIRPITGAIRKSRQWWRTAPAAAAAASAGGAPGPFDATQWGA